MRLSQGSVRSLLSRARHTLRMRIEQGAASLAGAQWLNLLTRLFGDTSIPVLSSATRTAAAGLGALAVTGGAIVAPAVTGHPHAHAESGGARSTAGVQTAAAHAHPVAPTPQPFAAPGEQSNLGTHRHHSAPGSDDRGHHSESGGPSSDQEGQRRRRKRCPGRRGVERRRFTRRLERLRLLRRRFGVDRLAFWGRWRPRRRRRYESHIRFGRRERRIERGQLGLGCRRTREVPRAERARSCSPRRTPATTSARPRPTAPVTP